jgi:hypothetical protein
MSAKKVRAVLRPAMNETLHTYGSLAKLLGTSRQHIYNMMTRDGYLNEPATIRYLARELGVDPDDLFAAAGVVPDDLVPLITRSGLAIRKTRKLLDQTRERMTA